MPLLFGWHCLYNFFSPFQIKQSPIPSLSLSLHVKGIKYIHFTTIWETRILNYFLSIVSDFDFSPLVDNYIIFYYQNMSVVFDKKKKKDENIDK
jgi:hypothetical protein